MSAGTGRTGWGRYLLTGGAVFVVLWRHARASAWLGDFWVHLPAVAELAARPFHPHNPLFGDDSPFGFLSPYALLLGLAARLGGLRPFDVMVAQGLVNLVLLLAALYAFVTTWLRRPSAAFYALLYVLFLWGRDPWKYSSFFHLRSLAYVLPYPSTFAAALALGTLAAFPRLLAAPRGVAFALALALPVMAFLWITHPVNGFFLTLGLFAVSLSEPRPSWHWPALALTIALSVALAFAWPLFSVRDLWFQQAAVVHGGNDPMYDHPLPRVAPALLGIPWMLVRRRRNPRDPLSILAAMLALLVVYGGLSGHWTYGRLISHLVLLLQVALADASAAFEERLARRPRGGALRPLVAPATAALLVGLAWSSAVKPTLDESVEGDPRWLSFLEAHVAHDDVVLADVDTCWYVPSFTGKVVAFPMKLPFVPDHAERLAAVTRFFERDVPFAERRRTIERYRVAWVLSARSHFDDGVARQEELRALGQVVYSSPDYELLQVTTPSSPKLLEQLRKDRGALDKATTYQVNGRSAGRSAPGAAPPILRRLRSG